MLSLLCIKAVGCINKVGYVGFSPFKEASEREAVVFFVAACFVGAGRVSRSGHLHVAVAIAVTAADFGLGATAIKLNGFVVRSIRALGLHLHLGLERVEARGTRGHLRFGYALVVEDIALQELALEVAAVVLRAVYYLVHTLQLGHGEYLVEEPEGHGAQADDVAEVTPRLFDNLAVVKSEGRQLALVEPQRHTGIRAGTGLAAFVLADEGKEGHCHHPLARVAVDAAEDTELLEVHVCNSGLLHQFSPCGILHCLVNVDETARQSPHSLKGLQPALHQKHVQLLAVKSEDDAVYRQRRVRVFVAIHSFYSVSGIILVNRGALIPTVAADMAFPSVSGIF